ncbi:MAG: hypothetical protein JO022_19015 [Acidobacteriaceae bacterium]|nr:hypothetical protein [Acidobacteriaceae bacterium]
MAKVKLAGSKKAKPSRAEDIKGALPCLFLVLMAIVVLMVIFYYSLQSSTQ